MIKDGKDKPKLNSLLNDCINIENDIKYINKVNSIIKKNINEKFIINFSQEEIYLNDYLNKLKKFGEIYNNQFKFKQCPNNIADNRKYTVTGEKGNFLTKTGPDIWMGTICEYKFEELNEYKWRIKILKTSSKYVLVGVAPFDFNISSSSWNTCGLY